MVTNPGDTSSVNSLPVLRTDAPSFVITSSTPIRNKKPDDEQEDQCSGDAEFSPNSSSTPLKRGKLTSNSFTSSHTGNIDHRTRTPDPQDGAGLSPRITSSLAIPSIIGRSKGMSEGNHSGRDIESVCTAQSDLRSEKVDADACWWSHPKVKENWRVFVAAFGLLITGSTLIVLGIVGAALPELGLQSYVFFIGGLLCFIPGVYHVVFVYCAVKGRSGYDFYQLPLFH